MPLLLLKAVALLKTWWPWLRWVLLTLAVVFAVLTCTQLVDYLTGRIAQHYIGKQNTVLTAQHQAARANDNRLMQKADSAYFLLQGQGQAAHLQYQLHQRAYDSLAARLPVPPVLPVRPPRYSPGANRR